MPLDNSLPDEIVSEILSPALTVADEVFSDTSQVSPFSNYSEPTSAYLVVCKSWLRVATPLLYNVVVVRSKAQAKALARALSGNVDLGRFIKKLRVEGGYGAPMHTILQRAPNISDLYLSFEIWTPDTTDGLCKGLDLISPSRLIFREAERKAPKNRMVWKLVDAVAEAIPKWDRLSVLDFSSEGSTPRDKIVHSLNQAKRLHTVVVHSISIALWTHRTFKECPLRVIQIKQPLEFWDLAFIDCQDPAIRTLLRYTELEKATAVQDNAPDLEIAPALNPFFTPLSQAPNEVQDAIWSRVLYFAMSVPERVADPKRKDIPKRLPLLRVSKMFHRLGLPHYYVHVVLDYRARYLEPEHILSQRPRIETLYGSFNGSDTSVSLDSFEALVKCSGPSLLECHTRVQGTRLPVSGAIFNDLAVLRKLTWRSPVDFVCTEADTPSNAMPRLQELQIDVGCQSFVTMLSFMKLESLRIVHFLQSLDYNQFLEAHGSKLSELEIVSPSESVHESSILDLCPRLAYLKLRCYRALPSEDILLSRQPTTTLAKVTFDVFYLDKTMLAGWEQFFESLNLASVPNLHEIHMPCFDWPTSERDIAKSHWVSWAEKFQTRNIHLTDGKGMKWRARLKVSGRR